MDCYIYAVEKSLDSYKFNLLQNKQVFINQLKSRNLAARTIDEGAIDENGGGNFSEYVAILQAMMICWKRQNWTRNWQSLKAKGRRITVIKEMRKES